jgi:AraC family transcriptional regulator
MNDITFEESRTAGGELEPREFAGHRLALQLNGPVPLEVWRGGRFVGYEKQPGRFAVTPAGATVGIRWSRDHHFLLATLAPELVAGILLEAAEGRYISLVERHGCDDPHARHLLLALRADTEEGRPSGRLYSDTLVRALVIRLLAGYSEERTEGMAPGILRRVRDYIEAHLADNPSLDDLAAVAGMSPYHFARTFARTAGLPPHRYLLSRRLEHAKGLLSGSNRPIVGIALDLGFGSQGHFHRAFRKYVGTTPGSYRKGR